MDCPFLGHRCPCTRPAGRHCPHFPPLPPSYIPTVRHLTLCRYYQPVRELVRQSLGQVYLALNKETGQEVIVKLIERGPTVSKHVERELLLHRRVPMVAARRTRERVWAGG